MALPKLEPFTGTANADLTTYNANWVIARGSSNLAIDSTGTLCHPGGASLLSNMYCWTGDTFSNDQYAQCVVTALGSGNYQGPCVRQANNAAQGYTIDSNNGDRFMEVLPGFGSMYHDTGALATSDVQRIEASGNSISYKLNGATLSTVTDNTWTSGSAGLQIYGVAGDAVRVDNWEGGNLGAVAQDTPELYGEPRLSSRQMQQLLAQ
jgi:hypothetical protein